MTSRLILEDVLAGLRDLQVRYSASKAIEAVIEQIEYLLALETGAATDRARLAHMTIGVLTAREIEDMNPELADVLYQIAAEVRSSD